MTTDSKPMLHRRLRRRDAENNKLTLHACNKELYTHLSARKSIDKINYCTYMSCSVPIVFH